MTNETIKFRPLGDRALLQREEAQSESGGILLPESAKKQQETAIVRALGPGKLDDSGKVISTEIKVGDRVLIDKYSGQEMTLDGIEYTVVHTSDIIAIVQS